MSDKKVWTARVHIERGYYRDIKNVYGHSIKGINALVLHYKPDGETMKDAIFNVWLYLEWLND